MENIKTLFKNTTVVAALILGLAFIIGAWTVGRFLYSIRALDNTISVSGSTREKVTSDNGKLSIRLEKSASPSTVKSGYQDLQNKSDSLVAFLVAEGIPKETIVLGTLSSYDEYNPNSSEKKYQLSQSITVASTDVNLLDRVSKLVPLQSTELVTVNVGSLEFFYSQLPELRISLIQKAIEDAKERARNLTEATGVSVGKLKSASTGIVQVVPVNSTDISDYGTYDTSTIEKEVVITVKASFGVK